jgi:glycosyltransferase involved in cell wall biosynthesis
MSSERVLLISYWFPPSGGTAVQRALGLAKYLPQNGFEVHVLTPKNPPSPVPDPSLLDEVPASVRVHRTWSPSPPANVRKRLWHLISKKGPQHGDGRAQDNSHASDVVRRILCPDPEVLWVPFAKRAAKQIVRRHRIDNVLVTAPPFSAFLIGNALKREFPHLRLVSDFRDEWLRFFLSTFDFQKSEYIRSRAEKIERATIELSDRVVSVTPSIVDELRQRYPDQREHKFTYIPNGYDPRLFKNFSPRPHRSSKVVVTHIGTLYRTNAPQLYFEALDALPQSVSGRIETRCVGRVAEDQQEFLASRADVMLFGMVSQKKALNYMEETDYLLLLMLDPTGATGKIYEYLAARKPILALSPSGGEVDRILQETRGGWCVDPADRSTIKHYLQQIASGELKKLFRPKDQAIRRYERPQVAQKFAAVLRGEDVAAPIPDAYECGIHTFSENLR